LNIKNPFGDLFDEAKEEAYTYFDNHIRRLPRNASGKTAQSGKGFDDNDVDAFRHDIQLN